MINNTNNSNIDDALFKEVEEEARKNLKGIIRESQVGYMGYLTDEMKKIFKEKGIDWKADDDGILTD